MNTKITFPDLIEREQSAIRRILFGTGHREIIENLDVLANWIHSDGKGALVDASISHSRLSFMLNALNQRVNNRSILYIKLTQQEAHEILKQNPSSKMVFRLSESSPGQITVDYYSNGWKSTRFATTHAGVVYPGYEAVQLVAFSNILTTKLPARKD